MSILLYCVTSNLDRPALGTGVGGLPVLSVEDGDLLAIFSEGISVASWAGSSLKESAQEFHRVLQRVFHSRALIPFRFPTVMRDARELADHLRDNAPEYRGQLRKFTDAVQMDITIGFSGSAKAISQTSGSEYLRERQHQSGELDKIAQMLQRRVDSVARDWRSRPVRNGLRAFALLDRGSVAAFKNSLQDLTLPPNVAVRVNGPWPVSEFLELAQPR